MARILLDWGYDRGLLYCERCGKEFVHDIDKAINPKDVPEKVPIICRGCNFPRIVSKEEWIHACKKFEEHLLEKFVGGVK